MNLLNYKSVYKNIYKKKLIEFFFMGTYPNFINLMHCTIKKSVMSKCHASLERIISHPLKHDIQNKSEHFRMNIKK